MDCYAKAINYTAKQIQRLKISIASAVSSVMDSTTRSSETSFTKAKKSRKKGKRYKNDIFMHAVYEYLYITEQYIKFKESDATTCLILTDYENFINPKRKASKNWTYDISHDYKLSPNRFTTSIGGKIVDFSLELGYHFQWIKQGKFWGSLLRPL